MFIVRKKYLIKIIPFIFLLILIITGTFLTERRQEEATKAQNDKTTFALVNNIYASLQSINNCFEKSIKMGTFENEKNEIYTQSYATKNLIYFAAPNMQNTTKWFSALCEYTKTDMKDTEKNTYYSEKLNKSTSLLLNICSNFQSESSIKEIEKNFKQEEDRNYYREKLKSMEEDYPLLRNQINADRSDITTLAKELLNFPISPKQFFGNYKAPKAISYSHIASYAEIFPSGKFLNRMAAQNTTKETAAVDLNIFDAARHYITIYASYAEDCKLVSSQLTNKLMYCIFCPENTVDSIITVNYNETIKLAINLTDNSLKAFDASKYLKNHNKKTPEIIQEMPVSETPQEISSYQIISKKNAILGEECYMEYCFSPDGQNKYYLLYNNDNSKEIYTEQEYYRILNNN